MHHNEVETKVLIKKRNLEKKVVGLVELVTIIGKKGRVTKKERYGDPHYTNREQAKKTNLKRYGYENPNSVPLEYEKPIPKSFPLGTANLSLTSS